MRTLWAAGCNDLIEIVRSGPGRERGGSFHIDPDGCVVIGDGGPEICAGIYVGRELSFEGFGMTVRSNPDDLDPGDTWTGPSVGRHYKMTSKDIWYESASGKSYALSDFDKVSTPALAARLGKKHPAFTAEGRFRGGRVYVNQHRRVFVPRVEDTEVTGDVYVGELRGLWFPAEPCPT